METTTDENIEQVGMLRQFPLVYLRNPQGDVERMLDYDERYGECYALVLKEGAERPWKVAHYDGALTLLDPDEFGYDSAEDMAADYLAEKELPGREG